MEKNQNLEVRGQEICKINKNYQLIINLMENEDFRNFLNKEEPDYKALLMFMKLYEIIENLGNNELTPNQKIAFIHNIVTNRHKRQKICDMYLKSKTILLE
jgi:hypothetical protein